MVCVAFGFAIKNVQCVRVCARARVGVYYMQSNDNERREFIFSFQVNSCIFLCVTEICFLCKLTHHIYAQHKTYQHEEKRRTYGRVHVSREQQQQQQQ